MNKEPLLQEISKAVTKARATALAQLALTDRYSMSDLLSLCYHREKAIAFRAAWILEFAEDAHPERFIPLLTDFLKRLPEQHNDSCQRQFTKILMNYTSAKATVVRKEAFNSLSRPQQEQLVELIFEWLIKSSTPVAVRVNCMDILYNMIPLFPWIREELIAQIAFYMKDGSAALQSRGKRLLLKLYRKIQERVRSRS